MRMPPSSQSAVCLVYLPPRKRLPSRACPLPAYCLFDCLCFVLFAISPYRICHGVELLHGKQTRIVDIKAAPVRMIVTLLLAKNCGKQSHGRISTGDPLPWASRYGKRLFPLPPIIVILLYPENPVRATVLQVVGFH